MEKSLKIIQKNKTKMLVHSFNSILVFSGKFPGIVLKPKSVEEKKVCVEMPGIEPGAFHMQSERSTAELHPLLDDVPRPFPGTSGSSYGFFTENFWFLDLLIAIPLV